MSRDLVDQEVFVDVLVACFEHHPHRTSPIQPLDEFAFTHIPPVDLRAPLLFGLLSRWTRLR